MSYKYFNSIAIAKLIQYYDLEVWIQPLSCLY